MQRAPKREKKAVLVAGFSAAAEVVIVEQYNSTVHRVLVGLKK
jgi:hypothetical protein